MASLILGVTGKKRSGKDTFASRLVDAHGFTRLAFADALKDTILDLDPWIWVEPDEVGLVFGPAQMHHSPRQRLASTVSEIGMERAKEIREVRRLLQVHGVAMRDHVDPQVWVNAVARKAAEVSGPVVITDVRFPNEAEWVEAAGGATIRVHRPGLESTDTHVSETALDDWSVYYEISNGQDIDYLHAQADEVARRWGY